MYVRNIDFYWQYEDIGNSFIHLNANIFTFPASENIHSSENKTSQVSTGNDVISIHFT